MLFELVAAITLALGIGGLAYGLRRISGGRLPKTVIPVAAALALVAFAIWGDYSWASRTASALPARVVVVDELGESNVWRPWSYLFPVTERLVALDEGSVRPEANDSGLVRADLYFIERRQAARKSTISVDCASPRSPAGETAADGRLIQAICDKAASSAGTQND
ncbi:hypothetical protein DYI37_13990 [Fulvimarina endophytica]|uniref:Uncharacterized protein n=1 Tax=Fulvimarina endophytica TaxID=2293836 RepID=A0A371X1H7_9HYPH|nr:hypothetical protein [Fulvimarina endophytica]RFC63047.1 hypothetical protein DYI37_13990 [Fulvimarina endophytica]